MMLTMAQAEGQERIERRRSGNCGPVEGRGRKHDMETRHNAAACGSKIPYQDISGHPRTMGSATPARLSWGMPWSRKSGRDAKLITSLRAVTLTLLTSLDVACLDATTCYILLV